MMKYDKNFKTKIYHTLKSLYIPKIPLSLSHIQNTLSLIYTSSRIIEIVKDCSKYLMLISLPYNVNASTLVMGITCPITLKAKVINVHDIKKVNYVGNAVIEYKESIQHGILLITDTEKYVVHDVIEPGYKVSCIPRDAVYIVNDLVIAYFLNYTLPLIILILMNTLNPTIPLAILCCYEHLTNEVSINVLKSIYILFRNLNLNIKRINIIVPHNIINLKITLFKKNLNMIHVPLIIIQKHVKYPAVFFKVKTK